MPESRKKRAAKIQDSIREVLFHDWDPIGVSGNPKLRDEYDYCIAQVYRILVGSRSEDELVNFLLQTAKESGDVCVSPDRIRQATGKLLAIDVKL